MKFLRDNLAIAIDGPAGSGKSTVARLVAEKLGFTYIDTGAMYRALTLKAMRGDIDLNDESALIELSAGVDIQLLPSNRKGTTIMVMLEGEDVSEAIRSMEVTVNVKHVARIAGVRKNMVSLQRKMANSLKGAVMEGRDIGTVVLPDSRFKFYLDAGFEERVERRFAELRAKGSPVTRGEVETDLKERDHTDKTRKEGPLKKAEDAILIDTTDLSIDEVVAKIVGHVKGKKR